MTTCPACSAPVQASDLFCAACGRRIGQAIGSADVAELGARSKSLAIALPLTVFIAAIGAISQVVEIDVLMRIRDGGGSQAEVEANDARRALIGGVQLIAQLVTSVLWLRWQHRAQTVVRAIRPEARTSPGWAVGWWFIPVANLFMPYRTVRDLWQGSTADGPLDTPSARVSLWWVAFLGSSAAAAFAGNLSLSQDVDQLITASYLGMASDAALVVSGILAIGLVTGIARGLVARSRSG